MPGVEKNPTKDVFICPNLHTIITEVVNDGKVPQVLVCPNCKEVSIRWTHTINQNLSAVYEWYKPNDADILRLTSSMDKPSANRLIDNINKGMLIAREKFETLKEK